MSRDASGTYTAPSNSFNPAVEGSTIDEGDWNTTLDDIEAALTDSLSVSGKGKITAHIDFDETTVSSPAANVGRLYSKDVGGVTSLFFKDNAGTDTNLLLSSPGIAYTFSTSTTMGDPGSGVLRFNNATLASVTAIAIDDNDANGADLSTYVLTWDDVGTTDRGTLIIQNRTSPGNVAIFTITGASTDNSGWTQLAVTYVTHAGSFASNAPLGVTYSKPGTGVAGAAGPNVGLDYTWSTSTSGDPGSGKVLVNNATPASATQLNISETNRQSASQSAYLATWDDSTSTSSRGVVRIMDVSNPGTNFLEYLITGAITDAGSYDTFPVTYIGGAGTIANAATVAVMHFRTGDKGADGVGTGDVTGPAASVDSEIAVYSSTTGKIIKRATTTGILKAASGVLSAATADADYTANSFKTISVSGQSDVVADSAADTLTLAAGSNITITTNASTDTITIAASGSGSGSPSIPQGRITLTTVTPVLTGNVSGATTVYYTPYTGQYVPIYSGSAWAMTDVGGELSQATTDTTKSPAACTTNSNYDFFVWNDGGTYRCTRGPAWSSDTSRGTGAGTTELQAISGIYTNKNAITNGPAANRGTYVGTIRTNGTSTVDFNLGASAVGGTAGFIGLWNQYNRVRWAANPQDSTASWSYGTASWRAVDASNAMRVSFVCGQNEGIVDAIYNGVCNVSSAAGGYGLGYDSTTALATGSTPGAALVAGTSSAVAVYAGLPGLGFHYIQALEYGGTSITMYGIQSAGRTYSGLQVKGMF